jgi:hypothetical protein
MDRRVTVTDLKTIPSKFNVTLFAKFTPPDLSLDESGRFFELKASLYLS